MSENFERLLKDWFDKQFAVEYGRTTSGYAEMHEIDDAAVALHRLAYEIATSRRSADPNV